MRLVLPTGMGQHLPLLLPLLDQDVGPQNVVDVRLLTRALFHKVGDEALVYGTP